MRNSNILNVEGLAIEDGKLLFKLILFPLEPFSWSPHMLPIKNQDDELIIEYVYNINYCVYIVVIFDRKYIGPTKAHVFWYLLYARIFANI